MVVQKLVRNKQNGWLSGVCAGVADRYGLPVMAVRVAAIFLVVVMPFLAWVYIGLWRMLPKTDALDGQLTVNLGIARLYDCQRRLFAIETEVLQRQSALLARIEHSIPTRRNSVAAATPD